MDRGRTLSSRPKAAAAAALRELPAEGTEVFSCTITEHSLAALHGHE